jgi:F-type H+-transporting ATPase subunit epsilon
MAAKITLRVVTPTRPLLEEEVDEVTARGVLGEFTVLPDHIAFLTLLETGPLVFRQGPERHAVAVSGGYAEVLDNVMTVLADTAEAKEEIDIERAQRAKQDAEAKMAGRSLDDPEFQEARRAWERARVRLEVAGAAARG